MSNSPLISCICITNNRVAYLRRAIICFAYQNYPIKELVISYPNKDSQTASFLEEILKYNNLPLLILTRSNDESVGNARNIAISKCRGDYICIWDDDDWYHSSRLSFQLNSIFNTEPIFHGSVLTRLILFDENTQLAYMSFLHCWENTLLCKKEMIYQNQYAHLNLGEDSHIIKFLDNKKLLFHIETAPFLYVYIYHGSNTWNYEHFKYLTKKSSVIEDEISQQIKKIINLS